MSKNAMYQYAERDASWMYSIGKIPALPHYTKPDTFVDPSGQEWSEQTLLKIGAKKTNTFLWPREWQRKSKAIFPTSKPKNDAPRPSLNVVLEAIQNNGKPICVNEISKKTGLGFTTVRDALKRLLKDGHVLQHGDRRNILQPQEWVAK